jgi:hypothetical protein
VHGPRLTMRPRDERERERTAELIAAASYGTVIVLGALTAVTAADVEAGAGIQLVAGIGIATWIAHFFAEVLAGHVRHEQPLAAGELGHVFVDGVPILLAPVLPACALLLGRLDVVEDGAARWLAVAVAFAQLLAVGVIAGRLAPSRSGAIGWFVAASTACGAVVVLVKVALSH